jgi:ketosteroid isomerase-like protein
MAHPAMETGASFTAKPKTFELREFFDRYAKAVTAADLPVLVAAWETPAFVLSDIGAHQVSSPDEIVKFFSGAKEHYNARGIVDTRADIVRYEWPSERMAIVTVRWPLIDSSARDIGYETSTYVLRRDDGGTLRVRSAIMHGATFQSLS